MNVEIGEKKKYSLYCTSNSVDQMKHENRNRLQIKFKYRRNLQNPIFGKIRYMKFKWRYQRRWFCVKQTEWKTACRCQNCNTNKPFGIRPVVSWEHHINQTDERWKKLSPLDQINNPIFHISINPTCTRQQHEKHIWNSRTMIQKKIRKMRYENWSWPPLDLDANANKGNELYKESSNPKEVFFLVCKSERSLVWCEYF